VVIFIIQHVKLAR